MFIGTTIHPYPTISVTGELHFDNFYLHFWNKELPLSCTNLLRLISLSWLLISQCFEYCTVLFFQISILIDNLSGIFNQTLYTVYANRLFTFYSTCHEESQNISFFLVILLL